MPTESEIRVRRTHPNLQSVFENRRFEAERLRNRSTSVLGLRALTDIPVLTRRATEHELYTLDGNLFSGLIVQPEAQTLRLDKQFSRGLPQFPTSIAIRRALLVGSWGVCILICIVHLTTISRLHHLHPKPFRFNFLLQFPILLLRSNLQ
jgi:hypothetical protein